MNKLLIILIGFGISGSMSAQSFLVPMKDLNFKQAAAVTTDSSVVSGTMSGASMVMGYLNSLRIKDSETGEVHKANKDNTIRIDVVHQQKMEMMDLSGELSGLKRAVDDGDIAGSMALLLQGREKIKEAQQAKPEFNYLTFERVVMPKNGKFKFLQLLNPGFDSRVKVYYKYSGEGKPPNYYYAKDGGPIEELKPKDYSSVFNQLFGDCPAVKKAFTGGGANYDNFSVHVYVYDQSCGG